MSAVLGFIFLVSLIVNCHLSPVTEFDIDFQKIEKKLATLNCLNTSDCKTAMEPECKCICLPDEMANCTDYKCIEHGLKELHFVCDESESENQTCRVLHRLQESSISPVNKEQKLCGVPVARDKLLEHIKMMQQRFNST